MQQAPVTKPHEQDDDNDEIDLMGLLGTLIDHKWLIAGVTGVFMAAGVAYALLATPVYQANALIQVEAKKNDPLGFSDISSMLGKESPSATEIELIKSRRNIGAAVDNLKLDIESAIFFTPKKPIQMPAGVARLDGRPKYSSTAIRLVVSSMQMVASSIACRRVPPP